MSEEDEESEDEESEDEEDSKSIENIIENTQVSNFPKFRTINSNTASSLEITNQEQTTTFEIGLQNISATSRAENEPQYASSGYQLSSNYDEGTYPEQIRTSTPTNPFLPDTFSRTANFANPTLQGFRSTNKLASSEYPGMETKKYESTSDNSQKTSQSRRRM